MRILLVNLFILAYLAKGKFNLLRTVKEVGSEFGFITCCLTTATHSNDVLTSDIYPF